jgi:hypothetical protein
MYYQEDGDPERFWDGCAPFQIQRRDNVKPAATNTGSPVADAVDHMLAN